jgi:hypothetical protein
MTSAIAEKIAADNIAEQQHVVKMVQDAHKLKTKIKGLFLDLDQHKEGHIA